MKRSFGHTLRIVAAVHVGLLIALFVLSSCRFLLYRKRERAIPVTFTVEMPAPERESRPTPAPPKPSPKPSPRPQPEPKPKKEIKRSTKRVTKQNTSAPRRTLSEEEIRKLLELGAKPGERTVLPDEESRCFELIRRRLHSAWRQPSAAEAADAVAEVRIRLQVDGRIVERSLARASGNAAVDASVMEAVRSVESIPGLSAAFLERYKVVTVAFRVE